jgi:cytochrome c5
LETVVGSCEHDDKCLGIIFSTLCHCHVNMKNEIPHVEKHPQWTEHEENGLNTLT